ncbi:MAG: GtrA family protein [Prevotellaceae bacterium]|jgi:putative flippase GtrA|nr:GtrA family protein [Prevotellaceae bacterium]
MLRQLKVFVKAQFSAFTGGMCDYFIMIFLTELIGVHYPLSIAISCVLGAVVNFSLNKKWSFYSKEIGYRFSLPQQLWRFFLVVISSIILKVAGTYCITTFAHIDYKISRIITDIVVSLCFNYVLQRYWVFKNGAITPSRIQIKCEE